MATLAGVVTRFAGSSWGFGTAVGTVAVWAVTGPLFHWSDTWQLVIDVSASHSIEEVEMRHERKTGRRRQSGHSEA